MMAFDLEGGRAAVQRMMSRFQLVAFAASLGGVETTISYPEITSHRGLTPEERARARSRTGDGARLGRASRRPRISSPTSSRPSAELMSAYTLLQLVEVLLTSAVLMFGVLTHSSALIVLGGGFLIGKAILNILAPEGGSRLPPVADRLSRSAASSC